MGATPKDEIERQHQVAYNIVHGTTSSSDSNRTTTEATNKVSSEYPYLPMTVQDEIPLIWKQQPTVNDPYYNNINSNSNYICAEKKQPQGINSGDGEGGSTSSCSTVVCSDCSNDSREDDTTNVNGNNKNHKERVCVATRGIINVDPIVSIIQEGYNYKQSVNITKTTAASSSTKAKKKSTTKSKATTKKTNSFTSAKATTKKEPNPQPAPSPTNLWDPRNAKKENVHITRPSHDSWGIHKIILLFCDDFLQRVYEMPYFHSPKYTNLQKSLEPIYNVLNITKDRIVRLLFASLPPGVTIPIHHDTGEWVKHTHRIHVPIIVPPNPDHILFRCGHNETSLQRVNCIPGHVFEMNNQGKHAVSNCAPPDSFHYRVHLILDYIDPDFHIAHRIKLQPGETITQSRRSIDRALDAGKRPCPTYMILGVQKSGTTSLYEYINQHPLVIRAKRRETHCLDWRWDDSKQSVEDKKNHCLSFFHAKDLHNYPSLLTGDSTPSYILDSYRVIPRLKQVFCHWKEMKFFVMLRNPTKRVKSHFEMVTSLDGTEAQIQARGTEWLDKSIEEVIAMDFQNMQDCGLIPYWDMEQKIINSDSFGSFVGSEAEEEAFSRYLQKYVKVKSGSYGIIVRGLYELQLRPWMKAFDPKQFMVLKLESMSCSVDKDRIHTVMDHVWHHLELPFYKIEDGEIKNARSYKCEMSEETKMMLKRFYKPHNIRLSTMLKNHYLEDDLVDWEGDPWE